MMLFKGEQILNDSRHFRGHFAFGENTLEEKFADRWSVVTGWRCR